MAKKMQYKDAVFRKYFMDKTRILSLYKAVTGDNDLTENDIELKTLDSTYDNGKKNDVAFLCKNQLIMMFEHQSTINENMPVRFLLYLAEYYNKMTKSDDRYRKKRINLPEPQCYIFYNGKEDTEPERVMNLAEAFPKGKSEWLNLKAVAYDINYDKGCRLFADCKELMEYSLFVKKVEEYVSEGNLTTEQAVCKAVNYCIDHDVMKEFMIEHREEVANMFTEEFDYDRALEIATEEAKEEGLAKGMAQGLTQGMTQGRIKAVRDMIMAGLTSLKAVRDSGLYTEQELSLIDAP